MDEPLLPPGVLRNVGAVERNLQFIEDEMRAVLPKFNRENLEQLSSIERAETFFTISKALNALFCLHLRTHGISEDNHPANSELERVGLYEDKIQRAIDRSTAPTRPTTSLDVGAANRFIEHAIPHLSEDQRKQILSVSRKDSPKRQRELKMKSMKARKRPSGMSVAEEAAAFLVEAREELIAREKGVENPGGADGAKEQS